MALDGRGWIDELNYPDEELLERLAEKAESVKRRIEEETGVVVEPVFYSALHKYNISKLLSYLIKCTPKRKRVFYAEKVNRDENNFLRDDIVSVQNRSKTYMKDEDREIKSNTGYRKRKNKNREMERRVDCASPEADEYNMIDNGKENYRDEYKK